MPEAKRLYHYTSAINGINDLDKKRLKIAEFHDLNDPYELLGVDLSNPTNRRAFGMLKEQMRGRNGVVCFSECWNDVLMWSHYGDRHRGICLGFDIPSGAERFGPVRYVDRRLPFPADDELNERFMRRLLFTKASQWKYEREWRAFVQLENDEWVESAFRHMFFKDFGEDLILAEVILGMACNVSKAQVKRLLTQYNPTPAVKSARMPHRTFELLLYS
jgi:hypothetical protein